MLQGIHSTVKNPAWKSANQHAEAHVEALADSGASALIISMDLAKTVKMIIYEKGNATLKDASNKHIGVSGRGEIMVQEEYGIPHKIKVLISRDLEDALSRVPVGGPEVIEGALRRMRGHASYAYNSVICCITGDICKEVIEDPALDEMWEAAKKDEGYQRVAETI